ncbi:retrovirus-related pol polyprotein from transposon TNT 1-94 [Tanacetum coccineum]|uniref:Retrovirus-related pol polyprotein from transposon TNT 1-94 n=1 Tax=Tanacetum coccineum TaxID=301880 RepID=A0ABQ4XPG8_9ASTR
MDSMILNGPKNTLVEYMILSSVDNRPPMLDKPLYDSWKSIIELNILKKYVELSASEKLQANCDLKDTKIILQGLPTYVYALVNHHRIAKDLFGISPNLTTHASLPPKWSKFVTDVKLVRDLHTTNFHQLKAYLEQHEIHVNEVRIMRERNQDPLALVSSHQNTNLPREEGQCSFAVGTSKTRANISGIGGNTLGQQRVMKCFNCQGEGHMARQCQAKEEKGCYMPSLVLMANLSSYGSDVLSEIVDNFKKGLGYEIYNAVPPPYIGNFMPPTPDLAFSSLDEFLNKHVVENYKAMSSEEEAKGNPQMDLQDQGVIDSGCSRHMIGNMAYLTNYEKMDR